MKIINNDLMSEIEKNDGLLRNKSIKIILQEFATYPSIKDDGLYFDTFMTLLLYTGYLTFDDKSNFHGEVFVRIPNMEVRRAFEVKLSEIYSKRNPIWVYKAKMLAEHLLANEIEESCLLLNKILGEFISVRNCGNEFFYHSFIQGLLTLVVDSDLEMNSEEESGDGYSDITLYKKSKATAVILEFKKGKNNDNARMLASEKALLQIIKKNYVKIFIKKKCLHVYGIGMGFGGKECEIKTLGDILSIN